MTAQRGTRFGRGILRAARKISTHHQATYADAERRAGRLFASLDTAGPCGMQATHVVIAQELAGGPVHAEEDAA